MDFIDRFLEQYGYTKSHPDYQRLYGILAAFYDFVEDNGHN